MVWKNPFLIRHAEKVDSDANFLQLFSSETLATISEESFNIIQFVQSTPGAGKTTLFKAFQPSVLSSLKGHDETMKEYYNKAMEYHVIDSSGVKLLSCIMSCAKNYDMIDSVFQNGRKQQVLFALLNARITILLLKNTMTVLGLETIHDLSDISFIDYPDEFSIFNNSINNGYDLYLWVQGEERRICQYLDELSDEATNFTFFYKDLFLLKLFEPHNVRYRGEKFLNYTLIIFDDVQKLTPYQRDIVTKTLYTMRPNLGVWIGERIEALPDYEIVTNDATENREYKTVRLEDFYVNMKSGFGKLLSAIADRRVKLQNSNLIKTFDSCLDNRMDYGPYEGKLRQFIDETKEKIAADKHFGNKYVDIIDSIENDALDTYAKAHKLAVVLIDYNRDRDGKQTRLLEDKCDIGEFQDFFEDNSSVANYYLCTKIDMPYYYGKEKIVEISSHNIEQFLAFAGEIFESCLSKTIIGGRQQKFSLNPSEQHKAMKRVATTRYDEITKRFVCGEEIKNLLHHLCQKSLQPRDKWKNSYNSGAFTGFGILKTQLDKLNRDAENKELLRALSAAISANYFERRIIRHGGQEWAVFYYNRWICVYYDLPLNYGGWFKSSLADLNGVLNKTSKRDAQS